ncbi:MAG: hypothetical protein EXR72_03455 [Myxococcales bacterium]|nr:hypothetical protein [Myxococcales bacterium]
MALLSAWLVAWAVSPHGEVKRQTSIVGGVAVAGGDLAAAAWLELRHGAVDGILHVVTVDENGRVTEQLRLPASADTASFRLADAGAGAFVLATDRRSASGSVLEFHRFGAADAAQPPDLELEAPDLDPEAQATHAAQWQIAAAGDQLVVLQTISGATNNLLWTLDGNGRWAGATAGGRKLIGAGGGHTVVYSDGWRGEGGMSVAPGRAEGWVAEVSRPVCFADGGPAPTVTSVVGLRGGYARLSRRGWAGCVDGIRDGKPFAYRNVPLAGIAAARLLCDDAGRLVVHEDQDAAQVTQRRIILPEKPGASFGIDARTVNPAFATEGVRYRLFGGGGHAGVTTLATQVADHQTQVVLERNGVGQASVLAPVRRYQPDHRPALRALALGPLLVLLAGALQAWRRMARLRRVTPVAAGVPLAAGPIAIEGELAVDAEAPAGGLRMRLGSTLVTLFIEGAAVLRASDVRPRNQPRGDAVDVASGASVVATGTLDPGALYRGEATLRARAGDLVLVGCTLAEARARLAARLFSALALLATAGAIVLSLALRR